MRLEHGVDIDIESDCYRFTLYCKRTIHGYCTVSIKNLYVYDRSITDLVIKIPNTLFGMRVEIISHLLIRLSSNVFLKNLTLICECSYCTTMTTLLDNVTAENIRLVFKFNTDNTTLYGLLNTNKHIKRLEIINETAEKFTVNLGDFCGYTPNLRGVVTRNIEFNSDLVVHCLSKLRYIITDSEALSMKWFVSQDTYSALFKICNAVDDTLVGLAYSSCVMNVQDSIPYSAFSTARVLEYLVRIEGKVLIPVLKQ